MASSIFQGQISDKTSEEQKRQYAKVSRKIDKSDNYKAINVSKIIEDIVPLENGGTMKVHPAATAARIAFMIDNMRINPDYSFLKPLLDKPVIWTYEAKTAFTDGIRIYMSPVFAEKLLKIGNKEAAALIPTFGWGWESDSKKVAKHNATQDRYVRFIIIHEAYHILYNHIRRAALKYGKGTAEERDRANVAMDLEINRDIEGTYEDLRGVTEMIEGIWFENKKFFKSDGTMFKRDIWEAIWDDWTNNGSNFRPKNPLNNEQANPKQKSSKQSGPFADGWKKAIDSIKKKRLNPMTTNLSDPYLDIKPGDSLADIINRINSAKTKK